MSEFLNKTKISALERSNTELVTENSNLTEEIANLKAEIDRLREADSDIMQLEDVVLKEIDPDEFYQLREKVAEYQRREAELEALARQISEAKGSPEKLNQAVQHLLSALQIEGSDRVGNVINKSFRKKLAANCTIAFLLGILATMVIWIATVYRSNWASYLSFWK